jgi:tetratricopeptide (TPR) repeat protein
MTLTRFAVFLLFSSLLPAGDSRVPIGQVLEWDAAAEAQMKSGAWDDARQTYLKLHASLESALGAEHPQTVVALANACDASVKLTARLDSLALCTRALDLTEKVRGSNSPETVRTLSDLALLYAADGDLARAGKLLVRAMRIASADPHSLEAPGLMNNLGYLYFRQGKYARSRDMFERAIAVIESRGGEVGVMADGSDLVTILGNLGTVELASHQPKAAERHFLRALSLAEESSGTSRVKIRKALDDLSHAEAALGKSEEATALHSRAESLAASASLVAVK